MPSCSFDCSQGRRCGCSPRAGWVPMPYRLYRYARDNCRMGRAKALWKVIDWWVL